MTSIFAITMWFLEGRSCDYAFLIQLSGRIGTVGRRSGKIENGEKRGKGKIIADCEIIVLGIVRCQWSVVRCKKSIEHGAWSIGLKVGGAIRFGLEALFICFVRFVASNI